MYVCTQVRTYTYCMCTHVETYPFVFLYLFLFNHHTSIMKTMILTITNIVITMITAMMAAEIPKTDLLVSIIMVVLNSTDCY